MDVTTQGVIRRRLAEATRATALAETGVERALPLVLARVTQALFGQAVTCSGLQYLRYSLAELLERVPDRALIAVLDGPAETSGVMVLSPDLLAALIEVQTLGRVTAQPLLLRRPTRTDAVMVADWVDAVLAGLEGELLAEDDLIWIDGFRYASHLDEARALGLLLEDTGFRLLTLQVDFAGARQGQVLLALPATGQGRRPVRPVKPAEAPLQLGFGAALRAQVFDSEVVVQAVLSRITLPLSAVVQMKPGDLLPLPLATLDQIEISGQDGQACAMGRLGQSRGMRALRLRHVGAPEETAVPEMATLSSRESAPPLRLAATG